MPELPTLPTLDGPTLSPVNGGQPKQLVILLHGVGSDGDDLIGLAPYFQKVAPGALFISPHAPYTFDMAPPGFEGGGHQWFSLQDMSAEAVIRDGFDRENVYRVVKLTDRNEYKRRQAAVGPRVSRRAFGKDRRYPITNGWRPGD